MLRSLLIGDTDRYLSPFNFGIAQGMTRLGHWHTQVSIRQPIDVIAQRVADVRPHVIWCHMLLWAPEGSPPVASLIEVVSKATRQGARVIIHDGDYKQPTRFAHDLSSWCALALCNHEFERSAWRVPVLKWPYFAFQQDAMADPVSELRCGLYFAGQVGRGPVYAARTAFLDSLRSHGVALRIQPADENTLFRTADVAASADAVLGFGRPGVRGWVDTRVFQYPGAGAILVHDDAGGYLEPWTHYAPYRSGDAASVSDTLAQLRAMSPSDRQGLRQRAFDYVQRWHSSVARVKEALQQIRLGGFGVR